MTILIVDDSRTMRMLIMRALKQAGFGDHEMLQAGDGVEALAVVEESSPDVILSDWNMPEMNGMEFLTKLRENGNETKFGFITTEGTADVREMATAQGASFFIEKPFTPEKLECVLSPVLQ